MRPTGPQGADVRYYCSPPVRPNVGEHRGTRNVRHDLMNTQTGDGAHPPSALKCLLACAFGIAACDAVGPPEPEFCEGYPCKGIELVSRLSAAQLGLAEGNLNDMWGWTDPVTDREWALVGQPHS